MSKKWWRTLNAKKLPIIPILQPSRKARSQRLRVGQHSLALEDRLAQVLSDKTSLRRGSRFRSLAVWQNTPHLGHLKRVLRPSAWLWCFRCGFRFRFVMWKIFCMNEVLRLASHKLPLSPYITNAYFFRSVAALHFEAMLCPVKCWTAPRCCG